MRSTPLVVAIAIAIVALTACTSGNGSGNGNGNGNGGASATSVAHAVQANAVVVRVVDGDTIIVDVDAGPGAPSRETVRLIGIDTPETVRPQMPVECFGPEASARTSTLLPPGTAVRLERDAEARDDYGRLLAYVVRAADGLFVNRALVDGGFASPMIFPTNTADAAELVDAARVAERAQASVCGPCAGDDDQPVPITCAAMSSLAERLGHPADAKLLIISCDDLGAAHAANEGVFSALHDGVATCASIMVPAPWSRDAARRLWPTDDIGVHLTLNCEHPHYRWGPITHAPSLQSGEGGFPRNIEDLWEHADPAEVLRECRAQIERAIAWGIDVTHLAPHLTAITLRPEFFDVYMELAVEFRLPVRLPSTISADQAGFPFRRLAEDEGVLFPDHFDHDWRAGSRERVYDAVADLQAGVTEVHVQPAIDTAEIRAIADAAGSWVDDLDLVTNDPKLRELLAQSGAVMVGYRDLRDAMRAG